jgi:predicted RNase H-like nuclease (RuvC/YqgF family)
MAKSEDEHKPDRIMIGETPDKEPIVKEQSTGKTFIFMATEKAEQLEKLKKEKEREKEKQKEKETEKGEVNIMADEKDVSKLMTEIAELKADAKNKEKAKYDKFLEGLAQKVDNVCDEVGGCRKDISDLKGRFDENKGKVEKDSKDTCVGLDCIKKDLKAGHEKLSKLEKLDKFDNIDVSKLGKLDKLDRLELYDCPECNKKAVPLWPEPANYCPNCGKPASWLEDDGKPLKNWHPPWKK